MKKITLNKETIANLNSNSMNRIKGGGETYIPTCDYYRTCGDTCHPSADPTCAITDCEQPICIVSYAC